MEVPSATSSDIYSHGRARQGRIAGPDRDHTTPESQTGRPVPTVRTRNVSHEDLRPTIGRASQCT